MANYETIRSYLVGLGYKIDEISSRKFEDALKRSAILTEKFAKGAAKDFTLVGGAFIAAASAITAGGIALASSVAKQDLGFQLYARRMYMATDAAKKMKIATDSLGYNLEEIIWGPPELADRYRRLVQDQTKMLEMLGPGFEKKMYNLREIGFQFDRLGVGIQYFGMRLTEDVLNKLFGGEESLEKRMEHLIDWFESPQGFVKMSDQFSNVLAPAILKVAHAFEWMWDKAVGVAGFLNKWLAQPGDKLTDYDQDVNSPTFGQLRSSAIPQPGGGSQAIDRLIEKSPGASAFNSFVGKLIGGAQYNQEILRDAQKLGLPPGLALAIADKESGGDPYAPKGKKGEVGMFQLMPDTVKSLMAQGIINDPNDPSQNIWGGLNWLKMKPGGLSDKIKEYNGAGPEAEAYRNDVLKRWQSLDPMGFSTSGIQPISYSFGDIIVSQPNATPEQIKKAVKDGIDDHVRQTASRQFPYGAIA
jgi:hypothetical protein